MREPEHHALLEHVFAKVLMLEAVQANVIAQIAGGPGDMGATLARVFADAENELRVMALSEATGSPALAGTVDRALSYLADYAQTLKAVLLAS